MSRERILRAAIDLADATGIEALSMRRLAQVVGVEAMTLYHYVANKGDLVDAIVDIVVGEIDLPRPGHDWKRELRRSTLSANAVLLRHPWAAGLLVSGGLMPARMRHMNAILGTLREAGFSARMTDHAYHALDSHLIGFALWLAGIRAEADGLEDRATEVLRSLPRDELPWLVEHIEGHLAPDAAAGNEFEFGLDLILDGLERMLGTGVRPRRARPAEGPGR